MSTSGDILYGAGIVLGTWTANTITQLRASRKLKADLAAVAAEAAIEVKVASRVAADRMGESASRAAAAGAVSALNGTAVRVEKLVMLVEGHIERTTERFDAQDAQLTELDRVFKERGETIHHIELKVDRVARLVIPKQTKAKPRKAA